MLRGRLRRSLGSGATAVRFTAILTAVGCCLAAAAYATTRPSAPNPASPEDSRRPLRPRILIHPDRVTTETTAGFGFSQPGRPPRQARSGPPLRMECRLDQDAWEPCVSPVSLTKVGRGDHRFAIHAVNRAGNDGPPAEFVWRRARDASASVKDLDSDPEGSSYPTAVVPPGPSPPPPRAPTEAPPVEGREAPPKGPPFTIRQIGELGELFPGAPAETIGVEIENPNQSPITVTSLTAAIASEPPDCPATENFILTPAAVTPAAPLVVAAESSFSLPEEGVPGPTIAMFNLPTNQDPCQAAELEIALSGEGRG